MQPGAAGGGIRFLIVDDVASNRLMLRRILQRNFRGCSISEAEDGAAALRAVAANNAPTASSASAATARSATPVDVDVVLMDGSMPVMDGYEATRRLREAGFSGLVIGVTGNALSDDKDAFTAAGADSVHVKPISATMLVADMKARLGLL